MKMKWFPRISFFHTPFISFALQDISVMTVEKLFIFQLRPERLRLYKENVLPQAWKHRVCDSKFKSSMLPHMPQFMKLYTLQYLFKCRYLDFNKERFSICKLLLPSLDLPLLMLLSSQPYSEQRLDCTEADLMISKKLPLQLGS